MNPIGSQNRERKIGFYWIDSSLVSENEKGTRVTLYRRTYGRRDSKYQKRVGLFVDIFLCNLKKECGCPHRIKKVYLMNENPRFYLQICNHDSVPDGNLSFLRDIMHENLQDVRMTGSKRQRIVPNRESEIHGVLASSGPVNGGNYVDLYFSVSHQDGMERYRQNVPRAGIIQFGENLVMEFSEAIRSEKNIRIKSFKSDPHFETCSTATFVIQVLVPPSQVVGAVDVRMTLFNEQHPLIKERGYTYIEERKQQPKTEVKQHQRIKNFGNNDFIFGDASFDDQEFNEEEKFSHEDTDIFGGIGVFYAIAQNNFRLVKFLVEKKKVEVHDNKVDLFGFSAEDVCTYFGRQEIKKYLFPIKQQHLEEEEEEEERKNEKSSSNNSPNNWRVERVKCRFCQSEVIYDEIERKITHKCTGKSARMKNYRDYPLSNFKRIKHCLTSVVDGVLEKHNTEFSIIENGICTFENCPVKNGTGKETVKFGRKTLEITCSYTPKDSVTN